VRKSNISPCIPVQLPLRSLRRDKFTKKLIQTRVAIARLDLYLQKISLKTEKILLKQESEDSRPLSLKAVALAVRQGPISTRLLCTLHTLVKGGSRARPQEIGKIRRRQNWIGPEKHPIDEAYFYPPDSAYLKKGLENLQEYFEREDEDPLVQLAIYFAQFLILHPFMDGNGRVARLVIPLFLYQKKVISKPLFFMSHYFRKHRLVYFHNLYLISTKNRWERWISFFLKGVVEETRRIVKKCTARR